MRRLLTVALALLSATVVAHPGTGVVKDGAGNIYYTDLFNIWKIDPSGRRSVAVRDVHAHELALDPQGRLVGEDVKYLGGDRYRHRVWRLEPSGALSEALPWTEGFWRRYGLVHNAVGTFFWVTCPKRQCTIFRRVGRGAPAALVELSRKDGNVNWLAPGPGKSVYFVSGRNIQLASTAHVAMFARDVGSQLMGLHAADQGRTLYVASYGDKKVYRLDARTKTLVSRSSGTWGPTGVWLEGDGSFLILEYSKANTARVRRLQVNGRSVIL